MNNQYNDIDEFLIFAYQKAIKISYNALQYFQEVYDNCPLCDNDGSTTIEVSNCMAEKYNHCLEKVIEKYKK